MVPFESFGTVSYSHFIVTMALSCIIFEKKQDIGRKSRFFIPLHSTSPLCGPSRSIVTPFGTKKTRMVWLREVEKKFYNTFNCFEITPACDCDRRTDRQTSYDSIVLAMRSIAR